MNIIPPGERASYDRLLADGIAAILAKAAEYDDLDIIEANVELMNDLLANTQLTRANLAGGAAALALRLHRAGDPRG